MPIHSFHSKAIRLNGYTDGLVVPTGAHRESGIDMFPSAHPEKTGGSNLVSSYESNDSKIGRHHIPQEGNALNNMIGAFTLEAFIIPDMGGVVLHKPNCYTLTVGNVRNEGSAIFDVHTLDPSGEIASQRVVSSATYPYGGASGHGTYAGNQFMPDDLHLPSRELLYVNAQFTGKRMRIYINTDLVADMDFGGEERIIRSFSSDVFIGGQGGEFRGVIESIRISRGEIDPILKPFTLTPDTAGLWNFEDEVEIPDIYFFNNKNPIHAHSGKDGAGDKNEGLMPEPMVCLGYDFVNVANASGATAPINDPVSLPAGNSYGFFRIRDFSDSVVSGLGERPSAYEKLAEHLLNIPVIKLKEQSWYNTGILDLTSQITKSYYLSSSLPVSPLNAVINTAGTHPLTGDRRGPYSVSAAGLVSGGINLDPMVNPIERVRIIAIDLKGKWAGGANLDAGVTAYDPTYPAGHANSGGYLNRPPCLVVQSTILKTDITNGGVANLPFSQGFLFSHSDDTPIWFTMGNGDLTIDNGSGDTLNDPAQLVRKRGQFTRARFTQGQRFNDLTTGRNDAYWFAPKSRMASDMWVAALPNSLSFPEEPPMEGDLALWLDSNDRSTLLRDDGTAVIGDDEYVHWWKNKASATALVAPENYAFFAWGDGWKYKEVCSNAKGRSGLIAANPSIYDSAGPSVYPGGNPIIQATVATPDYPVGQYYWGGSSWVNGEGEYRVPSGTGIVPIPFLIDPSHTTTVGESSLSVTDGDWSFYFVITPIYDGTNPISLLHSESNDQFRSNINYNGVQASFQILGMGSPVPTTNDGKPNAGFPSVMSVRLDEAASEVTWITQDGTITHASQRTFSGYTGTSPLVFDETTAFTAGMELLGRMNTSGVTSNSLAELSPPGFIVHEVLIYPKTLTDVEDTNVRQWLEDKYGVDA
jgi:hypothetical protein